MNETRLFAEKVVAGIMDYLPEEKEMQCRVVETKKTTT